MRNNSIIVFFYNLNILYYVLIIICKIHINIILNSVIYNKTFISFVNNTQIIGNSENIFMNIFHRFRDKQQMFK